MKKLIISLPLTMFVAASTLIFFSFTPNKIGRSGSVTTLAKTIADGDPLPSWNEGDVKKGIIDYVTNATKEGGAGFIPVKDRIAVFDNDGTLWSEKPLYFPLFYTLDRVKQMAPQHPEWNTKEPFKSVLEGNLRKALSSTDGLMAMVAATSAGLTSDEYDKTVKEWIDTARHLVTHKKYSEMVFQPMLELMQYLRANGFQTFIVSGGEIGFIRAWAEKVYGIPPQQVVGTVMKSEYQVKNDTPVIMRMDELELADDGPGKPIGIYEHIGKKPVFAAGNSDGDYQMLQWTSTNTEPHMEIIVHHTDSTREYAYDRGSNVGKLEKGIDDAPKYGWVLVDMKRDWNKIYP